MLKKLALISIALFSLNTFAQSSETPQVTESSSTEEASAAAADTSSEAFLASLKNGNKHIPANPTRKAVT